MLMSCSELARLCPSPSPTPTPQPTPTPHPSATPLPTPTPSPYATATDGTPLTWDLKMPPGKSKAPWVLSISSGHWVVENGVPPDVVQSLLNAGFASVHVFHHLAPPNKIANQVGNGRYPQQTDDIQMAINAARSNPQCDGRIAVMGGSGGANLSAILQAQGQVFAAILFSPATYLPDLIVSKGAPAQKCLNYAPTNAKQIKASPTTYMKNGVSSPVMSVFYQNDQMPDNQRIDYDNSLNSNGIEHTSIIIPGSGHSWSAHTQVNWLEFLQAHLPPP